jgi:hypothetical protein
MGRKIGCQSNKPNDLISSLKISYYSRWTWHPIKLKSLSLIIEHLKYLWSWEQIWQYTTILPTCSNYRSLLFREMRIPCLPCILYRIYLQHTQKQSKVTRSLWKFILVPSLQHTQESVGFKIWTSSSFSTWFGFIEGHFGGRVVVA